ncbi:MAG: hypothetical protein KDE31_38625, partial [Caldilineaceae bacterium]|nr:hypothetical protein [Caldilineaceae bacterium]
MAANDTAKVILREYEAYDKNGVRGAGYDTIYVLRLPQITVDNAFCNDRDTVYCGEGGKLGPYMIAGYGFDYGAMPPPQVIDRYQAISFVETKFNPVTRQLEFYPAEFDPKCGVSVHVDAWPLGGGECSQQYKVNVEIKQTCYGTAGLYTGAGIALPDVASFVATYHPKHWEYTRSNSNGQIDAIGTNLGTVDVFDGVLARPNPLLKQIDVAGATAFTLYNGTAMADLKSVVTDNAYARMCVNVPTEGTLNFTVANSLTSYAGYELNGEYVALATGAYSLDLEPCDQFCFVSYGGTLDVTAFSWTETVMPAPLEMVADGYWRCE